MYFAVLKSIQFYHQSSFKNIMIMLLVFLLFKIKAFTAEQLLHFGSYFLELFGVTCTLFIVIETLLQNCFKT